MQKLPWHNREPLRRFGDNSGYFDRQQQANPSTFDRDGQPVDEGCAYECTDWSFPSDYVIT